MNDEKQPCGALAGNFCSGETPVDDCMECLEFVTTCDNCRGAGSNESIGWYEGPNETTLCIDCYDLLKEG